MNKKGSDPVIQNFLEMFASKKAGVSTANGPVVAGGKLTNGGNTAKVVVMEEDDSDEEGKSFLHRKKLDALDDSVISGGGGARGGARSIGVRTPMVNERRAPKSTVKPAADGDGEVMEIEDIEIPKRDPDTGLQLTQQYRVSLNSKLVEEQLQSVEAEVAPGIKVFCLNFGDEQFAVMYVRLDSETSLLMTNCIISHA